MSIQGSVNQLLGITGVLAGIAKNSQKKQNKPEASKNQKNISKQESTINPTPTKRIVINPYITAKKSLETEGSNKILQQQIQAQRRKDKGDL